MTLSTTSPGDERERLAFEAWHKEHGMYRRSDAFLRYDDPDEPSKWLYVEPMVDHAWFVWQAARASSSAVQQVGADEVEELRAQIERLTIRGQAHEDAYRIAYHGLGCPECIRAREARENCDQVITEGLQKLADRASSPKSEQGDQQ